MSKPPPMKEAVVLLWDLGRSVKEYETANPGENVVDKCRATMAELMIKKIQFSKQDEVGVVVTGTRETSNSLNTVAPSQYKHITTLEGIRRPTCDSVRKLATVQPEGGSTDLIDALIVASDLLQTRVRKLRYRKRIFLFTLAGDPVNNKEDLDSVVSSFHAQEITLIIVGIDFKYLTPEAGLLEEEWDDMTTKEMNEKVLWHIVSTVKHESLVIPLDVALQRVSDISTRTVAQRTVTRGCIEFGEGSSALKIPTFVYSKTLRAGMPSLRRVSRKARVLDGGDRSACKVDIERRYFRADDPEREVPEAQRVKSFRYGCTVVPFNEFDEKILKFDGGVKGFRVLAFVPTAAVRRHHMLQGTMCLAPPPGDQEASNAFQPFLQAMYETNVTVLLRVVRRNYGEPVLCAGWPHITRNKSVLYMAELPFCEDLRKYEFKNFAADEKPSDQQLAVTEELIKSMDLMTALDDDELESEAVKPRDTYNPLIAYFSQNVRNRIVRKDAPLAPLDAKIAATCSCWAGDENVLAPLFRKATPHADRLKSAFSVKPTRLTAAEANSRKRKYWFADGAPVSAANPPLPAAKRKKPAPGPVHLDTLASSAGKHAGASEGGGSSSSLSAGGVRGNAPSTATGSSVPTEDDGSFLSGGGANVLSAVKKRPPVDKISTVAPVRDFRDMVARKDGDFVDVAVMGMKDVVRRLLRDSIGTLLHEKAEACVVALRDVCLAEGEAHSFNAFLSELKASCLASARKQPFWHRLAAKRVTLITQQEAPGEVSVTPAEALSFVATAEVLAKPAAPAVEKPVEDDLFDALD